MSRIKHIYKWGYGVSLCGVEVRGGDFVPSGSEAKATCKSCRKAWGSVSNGVAS